MCVIAYELRGERNIWNCNFPKIWPVLLILIFFPLKIPGLNEPRRPEPQRLRILTTSLPSGTAGSEYSAKLTAAGGKEPYTWSLTSGTLPAELSLGSATGVIKGTPTAPANAISVTFRVRSSGQPVQNTSVRLSLTIALPLHVVTTNSLPSGEIGMAYSARLVARGGTAPYKWFLGSGTLPDGLSLSMAGAITGRPATAEHRTGLSFVVTDSGAPRLTAQSEPLAITINPAKQSVSIVPRRVGLTVRQSLSLTATLSERGDVIWSATGSGCDGAACGTFSARATAGGSPVTYTAPRTAGQYTVIARSVHNPAVLSSLTVAVTDLTGVATYHNNASRNGVNSREYALTPSNVAADTFGKLFSCPVDGAIYAQPLWVPNLMISGRQHNVIFVATEHDSLYAFDADTSPCRTLWHANLIDPAHGGTAGETSVPYTLVGLGLGSIMPEVGVTGTPAIDLGTKRLYVVSKSIDSERINYYQRLHSIDLFTGSETLATRPAVISAVFPAMNSTASFSPKQENQRAGLTLVNGVVYIAWGSLEDADPWYGWVMGYDATNLSHLYTFNTAPNTGRAGIWMGGGAPSADASGNLYVVTGNGDFDAANSTPPNNDYGDSFLKLTGNLMVSQYFTPADQSSENTGDQDLGSGGTSVVVDLPTNGTLTNHLVVGGGKEGYLCVLNRDAMGGYSSMDKGAVQMLNFGNGIFGTPAYWNWSFYLAGKNGNLQQFTLNSSTYKINNSPTSTSATSYSFPGATPSISTKPDNSDAIVWALDNTQSCTTGSPGCGPTVLHAYDATNLGTELWNSSQGPMNAAGLAVKFTVPTVANGKVYVGTRGNDSEQPGSTSTIPGELDVYGLLPK